MLKSVRKAVISSLLVGTIPSEWEAVTPLTLIEGTTALIDRDSLQGRQDWRRLGHHADGSPC